MRVPFNFWMYQYQDNMSVNTCIGISWLSMYYASWVLKILQFFDVMLCCGRKKDIIEQDIQTTQHRSLLDAGRGSTPRTITGASGRHQKHLYSRSYPESEAVAFGGRPHLQGRDPDGAGRTADGRRQRDYWVRNKFGGEQQQMLQQHQLKIAQKLQSKLPTQYVDMGIKSIETFIDYTTVETVEINKRPGQTLGFYIREGNGIDRTDGVFISRIAAGSAVEQNGLLRVGEEILAIDGLSLKGVCLDDVVILMSIPSRLMLTVRTRRSCCKNLSCPSLPLTPTSAARQMDKDHPQPQVYVSKKPPTKSIDQPHLSSLSRQYLAQSYQPSAQPLYPKEHKFHKAHRAEFSPEQATYVSHYPRFLPSDYGKDTKQPYLRFVQKEGYKFPSKMVDTHAHLYQPYRRSRIEGLKPDDAFGRMEAVEESGKLYRRAQAESLDRKTNGAVLNRKYRSHDYYSDSEAQIAGDYYGHFVKTDSGDWIYEKSDALDTFRREQEKMLQREGEETDDLAGIRELSRSLSRRRKAARLQMERWRQQREQVNLERRIEEQQKQLYLLQQQFQAELQKQQSKAFPHLQQTLSYPTYFDQYRDEYEREYPPSKYISFYPPLQQHRLEPQPLDSGDYLMERLQSKKKMKLKSDKDVDEISSKEDQIIRRIPHRRRYSSDSEILQTGNGKSLTSPSTKLFTVSGLLANGGKCNSLPADIENGGSASNGDDPTQLKHWLRKLDRLSYDLRDFNHHNNRNKKGEIQRKTNSKLDELDFEKRLEKLEEEKMKHKGTEIVKKGETSEHASYTSEEYKSWISDRRLQSKLQKEKAEMLASRPATRPISGRDRAKIALSESRQKLAQSHLGHVPSKLDRHKKHAQTSDLLKKKFTTSASQTTPTIDPEKRKAYSLDQEPRESKASRHASKFKSKTVDIPTSQDPDVQDIRDIDAYLLEPQESEGIRGHGHLRQQLSLPCEEQFGDALQMPEQVLSTDVSRSDKKMKKKNGQCDQLREEPLRIRVEDFHPHCAREAKQKDSKRTEDEGTIKKPEHSYQATEDEKIGVNGLMYIKLFCGHGLKSSKRTILRDLYCVISSDGINKARTATKTGALNFDWDEDFEVELDNANLLGFSIYNWDPVSKQKLCFTARLVIPEFLSIHGNRRRLAMKLHPTGTLYVELIHKDLSERFCRVPIPAEDAIFGVDLDEIVSRERKGQVTTVTGEVIASETVPGSSRVPRIVRTCVRQVELRGLDCVGIYRLCGSYDRLQKLKRDLERGCFNEELLCVDNIPDINVIANVLKTFFQELPEPLLTSDLHQMFVDAINVQIETDPDGNASLMLSILDCLPKNNLAVFSFLMDHLKRIVQHRQFNKMNSEAVGGIFGPLLLCPPISNTRQRHQSHSKRYHSSSSVDLYKQAQVITYLLDIWPTK